MSFVRKVLCLVPRPDSVFRWTFRAIQWADQNLEASEASDSEEDQLEMGLDLQNADPSDDQNDDF